MIGRRRVVPTSDTLQERKSPHRRFEDGFLEPSIQAARVYTLACLATKRLWLTSGPTLVQPPGPDMPGPPPRRPPTDGTDLTETTSNRSCCAGWQMAIEAVMAIPATT